MAETDAVQRATGRSRAQWFSALDRWGAPGRPYREIADWLTTRHDISKWWAQKLIVEYEQDRGLRAPGVRRNGTFEVGASKTIDVHVDRLFDAVVDGRRRRKWLTDGKMTLRDSRPGRTARFDWADGSSRVTVTFEKKGPSKSTVTIVHERLQGAAEAQATKAKWRGRLADLKTALES